MEELFFSGQLSPHGPCCSKSHCTAAAIAHSSLNKSNNPCKIK
uniref:Uncharacterized protein n=1 Tax=Arundo donax TaxID=35708 RepID=A0A0A9C1G8_ARUDO